ncbi:putative RAD17 protein [Podospora didyma]|uniref:RAD17 protein n=1 Tax=Podospora didyma TaxID=330526 RepID=A0AAE0U822_9PEZI|nr:putative RAD17 protein [Podospora didyma]
MAQPAKRRKRAVVDDSDEDDDNDKEPLPARNTIKRFLFSSPEARKPAKDLDSNKDTPQSPSPIPVPKKRPTRASVAKSKPVASAPSIASRFATKAPTKSPSTSPEKSRTRAQKKLKAEEKGKSADLLTLFSRQSQRSQASSYGNNNKDIGATPFPLDDIISDPISDDDDLALHKTASSSSIVGNAAHKRFKDAGFQSGTLNSAVGQRFLKQQPKSSDSAASRVASEIDARPWSERFAPVNLDELAVHKKKVADVRKWLEDVLSGRMRQRLLILKGAAGTGKTTTVQLLAKDMRCEVLEWRNPSSSYGVVQGGYQSVSTQFEEFLGRGGKFGQLDMESDSLPLPSRKPALNGAHEASDRKLILIEEFPNTFMRSSIGLTSFRNTILQFLAANMPPLTSFGHNSSSSDPITPIVMIISETLLTTTSASADSFTAHRLLGPEILRHPGIGVIEFNSIAPTLLAKALEIVVQKEARKSGRRRTPGPLVFKRLGEIGDIRNAIASLEFLCVKGDDDADWGSKVALTKPKRGSKDLPALTRGEHDSLQLISQREATLGIFHAVGKVVYNKRGERTAPVGSAEAAAETLPDYMAHLSRPKQSEVCVDSLIDETGTDTHTFISALHENFALSCEQSSPFGESSSLDYLNGCLDYLSESDLLCPSWDIFFGGKGYSGGYMGKDSGSHILRQDEMAFQVAVRGLLFSLPSPVRRQTHPTGRGGDSFKMFYPAYLKLWRAKEELESLVDMWATKMLRGEDGGRGPPQSAATTRTNGASAFMKKESTGVRDWASNNFKSSNHLPLSSEAATLDSSRDPAAPPPLLSLGTAARQEFLLERLPYMAHIARRRRCSFGTMRIKDIDKVVSFQGIGPAKDLDDDQDDDNGNAPAGEAWATDKPTDDLSPRKKRRHGLGTILSKSLGNKGEEEEAPGSLLPIQSLVLSDDDIEDF